MRRKVRATRCRDTSLPRLHRLKVVGAGAELGTFGSVHGLRREIGWRPYSVCSVDFRADNLSVPA